MLTLLFEFLPVLVFFIVFKVWGLIPATVALVAATLVQVTVNWVRTRTVNKMHVVTAVLVLVFGAATVLLDDEMFIKWKPTIVYWLFAAAFAGTAAFTERPLLKRLLGSKLTLPDFAWSRLNLMWIAFFAFAGVLNLWVVYRYSTDTWVNFKLFAAIGLPLLFAVAQGFYIARHVADDEAATR